MQPSPFAPPLPVMPYIILPDRVTPPYGFAPIGGALPNKLTRSVYCASHKEVKSEKVKMKNSFVSVFFIRGYLECTKDTTISCKMQPQLLNGGFHLLNG